MIKKIAIAFCALFLLAGCSSSASKYSTDNAQNPMMGEFEKQAGDRVFFAYNSYTISPEAKATLNRQSSWLKENKSVNMIVEGHCDERGTREYNIALGEKRANAVKRVLLKDGVEAARIETISYGKERPAVMGDNEAAWNKNRRGVTVLK